ncbi:glycosyltransferase [Solirubrobacter phytolaccae]|uniref:Glycosyltransferase n=1 Tax=Solirubrobacter phytolaccae TaxID=1404360 RepID=A0A9X3N9L1_9ACTN|nr:glycosyltransferase [Solirubrobacter phytolaccae]MDA0182500.1 glycosyltransferase [Solirubrobacter phytolaccae]
MAPPASIVFPTRNRRDYLAVALASVAPQASVHGAEIVVVEDDAEDAPTRALVEGHGGRYIALGAPKGINAARNACVAHSSGDLVCFLDDDVEVWPGWLDALLAADPRHEALGGPIRPRIEGNLHACGREPLPVTALDLGPEDREAEFAWGANLALRRSALERIGPFDERLGGAGDEEDWQRRLRAAGGSVGYVAKAGVDHRRVGRDATLRALSRANFYRGRAARRYDVFKRADPSLLAELRTLAGCLVHIVRYRCGVGVTLTALTLGRLVEALDPAPAPPSATDPDYLSGRSGTLGRRGLLVGALKDILSTRPRRTKRGPRRRVHVVGVARPDNLRTVARLRRELARSRHDVALHLAPPAPGAGKWANINAALAATPLGDADWLLLVDDDVILPRGFLDRFLTLAEGYGFELAQPAHAFASHAAWDVTRRRPGVLARRTRFVEIGPVTAISARAARELLPFPDLRMGWGLDGRWSAIAAEHGWPIGVIDATPVRHLKPVATAYPRDEAIAEAEAFLDGRAYVTRTEAAETLAEYRRWPA